MGLGNEYFEAVDRIRALQEEQQKDHPLLTETQRQLKAAMHVRRREEVIAGYQDATRQRLRSLRSNSGERWDFKEKHVTGMVREGVQEYHRQAAKLKTYFPSDGRVDSNEWTRRQRREVELSIQALERNRCRG